MKYLNDKFQLHYFFYHSFILTQFLDYEKEFKESGQNGFFQKTCTIFVSILTSAVERFILNNSQVII